MACLHYDCPQAGTAMGNFLDQRCMWVSAAHLCRATPGQASWVRSESMWVSIAMWFCFRFCLRPWIPTLASLNDKILPTINCFWSVCDIATYLGHVMKRFTCELTVNFSLCPVRPTESMYPQGYWFLPSTWFGKVAYEVLIRFYFLESLSSLFWSCSWLHLSTPRVGLQKLRCSLAPLFSLHPHCKKLLYHCHKSHPGLVPWYLFVPQCPLQLSQCCQCPYLQGYDDHSPCYVCCPCLLPKERACLSRCHAESLQSMAQGNDQ